VELRDGSGGIVACEHASAGDFTVEVTRDLDAGRYFVLVDSTAPSGSLFDPLAGFPIQVAVPGAGVRGGFVVDVELATRSP
jgi:hypothetical protein